MPREQQPDHQFGSFLSSLRTNAKLSLEELAKLTESSKSTLSRLEQNEVTTPFRRQQRKLVITLAEILCTSPHEIARYLHLAALDHSQLTEEEELQLNKDTKLVASDQEPREYLVRQEQFYAKRLTSLEEALKLAGNSRPHLEQKLHTYETRINEVREKLRHFPGGSQLATSHNLPSKQKQAIPMEPQEGIIVLNFGHPLTNLQREQIQALTQTHIDKVIDIPTQIIETEPLEAQVSSLADATGLTTHDWQTRQILVNLPGYAPIVAVLLAELHGRAGHFPTIIRLRPFKGAATSYEVAEIINLQTVRGTSRLSRQIKKNPLQATPAR